MARGWKIITLHHIIDGRCSCAYGPRPSADERHDYKQGGKHPTIGAWQHAGAGDTEGWRLALDVAGRDWAGCNIGIVTGKPSGIWVLDVDPENGGDRELSELESQHGKLPQTHTVITGSGGQQMYWKLPADFVPTNANRLPPGLDTRGGGGQVVAAPSVSGKGPYLTAVDMEPIDAPEWLLDYVRPVAYEPPAPRPPSEIATSHRLAAGGQQAYDFGDRLSAYATTAVQRECEKLARAPIGARGSTAVAVAYNLIELANSEWAGLDVEQVAALYMEASSMAMTAGGNFDGNEARTAWLSAARKIGSRGRPEPDEPPGPLPFGHPVPPQTTPIPTQRDGGTVTESVAPVFAMPTAPTFAFAGTSTWTPGVVAPAAIAPAQVAQAATEQAVDTWEPVDVTPFLDGSFVRPQPTLGWRSDGKCLLYQGKEHLIFGESESGKSWLALMIIRDCLLRREPCVIIDFEDDASTFVHRLLLLGVPADILRDRALFAYVSPDQAVHPLGLARLIAMRPYVVMLDGKTEAYGLHRWKINDNDDAARWRRTLILPFTRAGAATIEIGHESKGSDISSRYGIGAQHQLAGLSGVAYKVVSETRFAPGTAGYSGIYLAKDRHGGVREYVGEVDSGLPRVGTFCLDTTPGNGFQPGILFAPKTASSATESGETGSLVGGDAPDPLATLKRSLMDQLASHVQDGLSVGTLKTVIPGKADRKVAAIAELERDGFVVVESGGRGSKIAFMQRPWTAEAQREADRANRERFDARFSHPGTVLVSSE